MDILFCTDGSQISYNAIINFSKWFNNFKTDILSVADWSCLSDSVITEGTNLTAYCTNSANTILNTAKLYLEEHNIEFNRLITDCGSVVDTILEKEKEGNYEYIVLGSNGKRGLQKWLGSVSQEISSLAQTSVFITKQKNEQKKVVFALDESLLNSQRLEKTIQNINLKEKEIHLLTVYETPEYMFLEGTIDSNWINDINNKQQKEAELLLHKFEQRFNEYGYNINTKKVLSGYPSKIILDYCLDNNIDLIVSGMRQKKFLSKLLTNSVSKRILENTPSDVLIMK